MSADVSTAVPTRPRTTPAVPEGWPGSVRRIPTRRWAPPFDDERDPVDAATSADRAVAIPLPLAPPSTAVPRLRLLSAPPAGRARVPSPPAAAPPPPAGVWCTRFVRVVLEALAGLRPMSQLGTSADAEVCRLLARRAAVAARCRDRPRTLGTVRSVHVCHPAPQVAEACAVVQFGERVRAFALRLESTGDRWRCTDLLLG